MPKPPRSSLDRIRYVDAGYKLLWIGMYAKCKVLTHPQQPSVRVELRPKKIGGHPHQLWCYHQGFLVNKHSGCVLGVEKDKIKDQCVFQSKRLDQGEKKQTWHYDNSKLVLRHGSIGYALNDLQVPKMTTEDEGCVYLLKTPY
ncbi:hypothetical protein MBANPS3_010751 [Mucor bainieri]